MKVGESGKLISNIPAEGEARQGRQFLISKCLIEKRVKSNFDFPSGILALCNLHPEISEKFRVLSP